MASVFPFTSFVLSPMPVCFITEQSTAKASLFANYINTDIMFSNKSVFTYQHSLMTSYTSCYMEAATVAHKVMIAGKLMAQMAQTLIHVRTHGATFLATLNATRFLRASHDAICCAQRRKSRTRFFFNT